MRQDVIAEAPTLTIWQVGTNAVWQRGRDLGDVAAAIEAGLKLLAGKTTDVVIMDLQYAPAVLTDDKIDATRRMLSLITEVSGAARVNVFRRFDLMRKFVEIERHSFDTIIDPTDPDRLHQSDLASAASAMNSAKRSRPPPRMWCSCPWPAPMATGARAIWRQ
jgi:hypothetical protein